MHRARAWTARWGCGGTSCRKPSPGCCRPCSDPAQARPRQRRQAAPTADARHDGRCPRRHHVGAAAQRLAAPFPWRTPMHWLYLLLAIGALLLALTTRSSALLGLALLAAAGFLLAWAAGWYRERVGDGRRDEMAMIDPAELRRLRELAEARRRDAAAGQAGTGAPPAP